MSKPSKEECVRLYALAVIAGVLLIGCPPEIDPGTDCWETEPGSQQGMKIPANFFGPASEPIDTVVALEGDPGRTGWKDFVKADYPEGCGCPENVDVDLVWVDQHGDPTDPTSKHKVKQVPDPSTETTTVDTCIYRSVKAEWDGENVGVEVAVELVGLSLKSVQPLEVVYHHTTDPVPTETKLFDVFISQSATQTNGKMTFTPQDLQNTLAKGKIELGELPIKYNVRFVEVGGGGMVKDLNDQPLSFKGTIGDFLKEET